MTKKSKNPIEADDEGGADAGIGARKQPGAAPLARLCGGAGLRPWP